MEIDNFLYNRFKLKLEKTELLTYNKQEWKNFCRKNNLLAKQSHYKNNIAHLLSETEDRNINLFHEYYGNGLYFEHSANNNKIEAEGFALWMEYYLSTVFNINYNNKFNNLTKASKSLLATFAEYSDCYTDYGLMYSCGMPKYYNKNILKEILKKIYNNIDLALLYGSKKPYSDIDIFIISEQKPIFLEWLDIYALPLEEANNLIELLDISVTEALFTGEYILGDKNLLNYLRKKTIKTKITEQAILHNIKMSNIEKKLGDKNNYCYTYMKNAKLLSKGFKKIIKS